MRLEVEVEVKPRGVTTREGGGERVRGELGLLWRDADGLDGGWSWESRLVPDEERFPSCVRDDVGVGVPGGFRGSRLPGRIGVDGAGDGVLEKRSKDGVDGEESERGSGGDFL